MPARPPGPGDSGRFFNVENVRAGELDKLLYATEQEGHKLIAMVTTRLDAIAATDSHPAAGQEKVAYSYTLIFERVKAAATVEIAI